MSEITTRQKDVNQVASEPGYFIRTIDDLYEIIRTNEKWREALRRELLSPALLRMPEDFARFKEEEFRPLVKKVDHIEQDVGVLKQDVGVLKQDVGVLKQDVGVLKQDVGVLKQDVGVLKQDVAVLKQDVEILKQDVGVLKQDVAVLKQDVAILKQDVEILKQDVGVLKQDVNNLKDNVSDLQGSDLERRVRDKAASYLGRLIRRCRTIAHDDLAKILDDALDEGRITEEMRRDAIAVDVVVTGRLARDVQRNVALAVEISQVVDVGDVTRAARRAAIIGHVMGVEGIGVAFGKSCTQGAQVASDEQNVVIICQTKEQE
ncbi:MAG: hypothetical protein ABWK15_09850 [Dissulfuribacterales bacterium]